MRTLTGREIRTSGQQESDDEGRDFGKFQEEKD